MHKMLERLIGEDIHLRTSLAKVLPPVKVDPGQIEQVIMNLAVNARDAMPTGGALIIETAYKELDSAYTRSYPELQPGKYASLAVTDTGCGMDEVVKARLFEPFFTTKEVGKGTGLGLATVYGIVKQSGGHITVYSEPGHGTTFKIYLPLVTEGVCDPSVSPQLLNLPPGNETVLLVEDEEGVRTVTREVLSKLGYKVLEAQHGQEALSLCEKQSEPIHLMVTDMVMPGMNGRQLASEVRRLYPDLKVLFLSGYSDGALVRNGMLDTSRDFLQKPFTPSDLSSKVREVLSV
jgi:CheY-like chemotaxis protein